MSDSINKFLDANPHCRAFNTASTNLDFCKGSGTRGANCAALGSVGAGESPACQLTSSNLATMVSNINDCQTKLFQSVAIEAVNEINENQNNLLDIAQQEINEFNIEVKKFESSVYTQINKLKVTNGILMGIIIIVYVFLGITVNFR